VFLGQLREAEVERLYERTKDAIMETCLAMTIFREEFNVKFVVMFVSLLFVKIFHWLCGDRVEYIETAPTVSRLTHIRVCTFMMVLLSLAGRLPLAPHSSVVG
jgi:E3 ubiquitin-protein ligase synoviolin